MIVGGWYAQIAAIWHWYLPLCIYVMLFLFFIVAFHPFFLSFFFNLVLISEMETEWSTIPACPSLMCSFDRGINIDGTDFEILGLMFVYTGLGLCLHRDWFCGWT